MRDQSFALYTLKCFDFNLEIFLENVGTWKLSGNPNLLHLVGIHYNNELAHSPELDEKILMLG